MLRSLTLNANILSFVFNQATCCPNDSDFQTMHPLLATNIHANCFTCGLIDSVDVEEGTPGMLLRLPFSGRFAQPVPIRIESLSQTRFVTCPQSPQSSEFLCLLPDFGEQVPILLTISFYPFRHSSFILLPFSQWAGTDPFQPVSASMTSLTVTPPPPLPSFPSLTVLQSLLGLFLASALVLIVSGILRLTGKVQFLLKCDFLLIEVSPPSSSPNSFSLQYQSVKERTLSGGFITLMASAVAIALAITYAVQMSLSNGLVLRALEPSPTSPSPLSSFSALILLVGYDEGNCRDPALLAAMGFHGTTSVSQVLVSASIASIAELDSFNLSFLTGHGMNSSLTSKVNRTCVLSWNCSSCRLSPSNLLQIHTNANSFFTDIIWRVSTVDYSQNISEVSGRFSSSSSTFLRGSRPCTVSLTATQVNFTAYSSHTESGVTLSSDSAEIGTAQSASDFGQHTGLTLELLLVKNPSWLTIQIIEKQSFLSMLIQLVAIFTGVRGGARLTLISWRRLVIKSPQSASPPCTFTSLELATLSGLSPISSQIVATKIDSPKPALSYDLSREVIV